MSRKRFSKVRFHRRASPPSRGWQNLSLYWYTTDKGPLIFIFVIGLVVTTFGYVMHSAFTRQDDVKNLTCLAFNVYFEARGESEAGS